MELLTELMRQNLETSKELCKNQTKLIQYIEDLHSQFAVMNKRICNLERYSEIGTDSKTETECAGDTKAAIVDLETSMARQAKNITDLETRLHVLEQHSVQKEDSEATSGFKTDGKKADPDVDLKNLHPLNTFSWSSFSSFSSNESKEERKPKRKGFKAAILALVFVNRLNDTHHLTENTDEKPVGDHLKSAVLAIMFMIKLMRAMRMPRVWDTGREITPD